MTQLYEEYIIDKKTTFIDSILYILESTALPVKIYLVRAHINFSSLFIKLALYFMG